MSDTPSPGQQHFRRIVRALTLICVAATAVGSIASFVVYLQKLDEVASGRDIYAGIRQMTALTYYSIWFCISVLAFAATFQKKFPMLPLYPLLAVLVEGGAFLQFFIVAHHLYVPPPRGLFERFETHPYLQIRGLPWDYGVGLTQDADGRRTTINQGKVANPRYIYVFGGSTTYDIGNTDADAWPSRLSADLGPDFFVVNYAIPLFSSLEQMLQSLFVFRDHPPACAIYYLTSNDLRSAHVKNLRVDYSELHLPNIVADLHPGRRPGLLVTYSVFFSRLNTILNPPPQRPQFAGTISGDPDPRLMKIFYDNISLISLIDKSFGVRAIFVPDIYDYNRLTRAVPYDMPFVPDRDIHPLMNQMFGVMKSAAEASGGTYLPAALSQEWGDAEFLDQGHFNATGSAKFAKAIAEDVRRLCQ